jgi:hypothetical protein
MTTVKSSEGKDIAGDSKRAGNAGGADRPAAGLAGPAKPSGQAKPTSADKGRSPMGDYLDYGNSFLDDLGNLFASMFGFTELNPDKFGSTTPGAADWGFDPVGAALGLAGSAAGVPGLGLAYGGLGALTDGQASDWGKVNMGPNVFGGLGDVLGSRGSGPVTSAGFGGSAVSPASGSVAVDRDRERGAARRPMGYTPPALPNQGGLIDAFTSAFGNRGGVSDLARLMTGNG